MIKETKPTERRNSSAAIAICIGSLPLMMALAPLSFSPNPAGWQLFVLFYSVVVPAIQFAIVLLIMHEGGSVFRGWRSFPALSRWAVAVWLPLTLYASFQPGNDHLGAAIGTISLFANLLFILSLSDRANFVDVSSTLKMWWALSVGLLAYFGVFATFILTNEITENQWIGPYPGFHNIRHVAFLGFVAYGAGLYHAADKWRSLPSAWMKRSLFASSIAGLVVVLWTGSRGPALAIILLTACCFILLTEHRREIAGFALVTLLSALLISLFLPLPTPMFGVLAALGLSDVKIINLGDVSSGRFELWLATINKIAEKPIFGWGLNQYLRFNPLGAGIVAHPHNSALQLLFVSGFSGFLLFLTFAFSVTFNKFGYTISNRFHISMILVLIFYSMYDGIFYLSFPSMIFSFCFVGCLKKQWKPV